MFVNDPWQERQRYGQVMYIITTPNREVLVFGGKSRRVKMISL